MQHLMKNTDQQTESFSHHRVITQIESGNSGHIVVPKAWIGKEAIVTLKKKENRSKGKK
jgi:putative transposon-encoded protein